MKLNVKKCVLAWQANQFAVPIQIHAIAGAYGIFLFAKLNRDQTVGAPGYNLVHMYFVVLQASISLSQRVSQIYLRVNGEVDCPQFGRFTEAVQVVAGAAKVVAISDAAERPLALTVRLKKEPTMLVRAGFLACDFAILVRGQVAAERTYQVDMLVGVLLDGPLLLFAQCVPGGVYFEAKIFSRQVFALGVHETQIPTSACDATTAAACCAVQKRAIIESLSRLILADHIAQHIIGLQ